MTNGVPAISAHSKLGGFDHGFNSRYFSSSARDAAFQSFRNSSTGRFQRSCTMLMPNSFPSESALSMASHPPSAHRARLNPMGSNMESTLYSFFSRAWTTSN
uniref:Uncharacterized protein n=1 Tax=Odontella aurita TaxID=265563 RepID=A0A7S4JLZ5_9STRA